MGLEKTQPAYDSACSRPARAKEIGRPHKSFSRSSGASNARAMDVFIRQAKLSDARAIAEVHVAAWTAAYEGLVPAGRLPEVSVDANEVRWKGRLASRSEQTLVCRREGRVIGFVSFGLSRDEDLDKSTTGEIYAVYLGYEFWSRGYGKALCLEALARLRERGLRQAVLWALRDNVRAIRFYEAIGFRPDGASKAVAKEGGFELREVRYRIALEGKREGSA